MKVAIQTLGCKVNFAEMADLSDRLTRAGFQVAEAHADPDVCVINSCTVTAQADRKVRTLVHGLRRRYPAAHLVLTGCHVDNPNPRISAVPDVDAALLTGVDLGAFGRDQGRPFAPFVARMLDAIAPARLRLSSINANDFTPDLVELSGQPRFCRHLHIPLQSGSDGVLKRMGRLYRRDPYMDLVHAVRERVPDVAITTDVIVGFPGETDADFAETQALAHDVGFSGMHVFRYSPRAGTASPRLGPPAGDPVSQERSRRLQQQAEAQRRAYEARFLDRRLEVIWDRRYPNRMRGLSDNYISVFAPLREQRLGALAMVRPLAASDDGLLVG